MNRIEFMKELEAMLQTIPAEERFDALQFYNDYFDEAGQENEAAIIAELGSPAKLASKIKADLTGTDEDSSEYSETGYTDTRFEEKDELARKEADGKSANSAYRPNEKKPKKRSTENIILWILVILFVGIPVGLPIALSVLGVVFGLVVAFVAVLAAILLTGVAVAIGGVVLFFVGISQLFVSVGIALVLSGVGMIMFAAGVAIAVLLVKLCMIIFPVMIRGIVNICRKPFQRKAVA